MIYYATALISRPLSNLMIFRECLRHRGKKMKIRYFPTIDVRPAEGMDALHTTENYRRHLLNLAKNKTGLLPAIVPVEKAETKIRLVKALAECDVLEKLNDGKALLLYRYKGEGYSPVLAELGRLREISFRTAGTGTGKKRDNDIYDYDYYHIILWDNRSLEIAGAYRLIPAGEQISAKGLNGLYSHSLYSYNESSLPEINNSIEVGRGFVQKRYQKTNALDNLWKGIFDFALRYPDYHHLLGVLTIPKTFPVLAQQMIVAFYRLYFNSDDEMNLPTEFRVTDSEAAIRFTGGDFHKDWSLLNNLLKQQGCDLPWPYKQAAKWYQPGGSKILSFVEDKSFNSVAGLNVCRIEHLKKSYYSHYITKRKSRIGQDS